MYLWLVWGRRVFAVKFPGITTSIGDEGEHGAVALDVLGSARVCVLV